MGNDLTGGTGKVDAATAEIVLGRCVDQVLTAYRAAELAVPNLGALVLTRALQQLKVPVADDVGSYIADEIQDNILADNLGEQWHLLESIPDHLAEVSGLNEPFMFDVEQDMQLLDAPYQATLLAWGPFYKSFLLRNLSSHPFQNELRLACIFEYNPEGQFVVHIRDVSAYWSGGPIGENDFAELRTMDGAIESGHLEHRETHQWGDTIEAYFVDKDYVCSVVKGAKPYSSWATFGASRKAPLVERSIWALTMCAKVAASLVFPDGIAPEQEKPTPPSPTRLHEVVVGAKHPLLGVVPTDYLAWMAWSGRTIDANGRIRINEFNYFSEGLAKQMVLVLLGRASNPDAITQSMALLKSMASVITNAPEPTPLQRHAEFAVMVEMIYWIKAQGCMVMAPAWVSEEEADSFRLLAFPRKMEANDIARASTIEARYALLLMATGTSIEGALQGMTGSVPSHNHARIVAEFFALKDWMRQHGYAGDAAITAIDSTLPLSQGSLQTIQRMIEGVGTASIRAFLNHQSLGR